MSRITKEQVYHIADLARLEINEEEAELFTSQLDDMINMVEKLDQLDATNVKPMSHVFIQENVMRDDKTVEGLPIEETMKNVPESEERLIKVPQILE
ncbi:Asp-tRNA(Asn)/Glu-tRNA(Gln) amidotransferase subunit GatC [Bacillus norwichensis]|uniref:Aspartyl/glutamyl-tRNA(Asn/Gln) amidotransferase subunit C n=1 Tax=Bacillus norwichensis TaxID=2762217 RepID=A0ABR8VPC9_9BACI|nr:Asp-tRNA(Asn)/Glu-tRNA(Gln) amidotransferase subunit GatC [Bacillus norwichensis]MBD8006620.1 Asp-tRNA(Asn)/Glu-tRNA(Gln) amidotransferase subunit GatC [Bacillus norwichensis]